MDYIILLLFQYPQKHNGGYVFAVEAPLVWEGGICLGMKKEAFQQNM